MLASSDRKASAYIGSGSKVGGGVGKCAVPMRLAPAWCDRGSDAKSKSLFDSDRDETLAMERNAQSVQAKWRWLLVP